MPKQLDKILIVDDDPEVRRLIREQVLDASRFDVVEAKDGPTGLQQIAASNPDMIILDLIMPGLSGADFLVALNSQGYAGPIIVVTNRGEESMAIDTFRLGATDYLTKPLREAEALSVIEHGLKEVRLRRERKELLDRLQQTNQQLEARIRELTTLGSIGRSVTGMLDLEQLFRHVLDAAVSTTGADLAMLLLRDEETHRMILRAGKNMTLVMQEHLGQAVNDDIASLVMTSGEVLVAAGDGLKRFRAASDLNAVVYAPLIIQGKPIGVLVAGNQRKRIAFDKNQAHLLEILGGYAAIAIANARLFAALQQRAHTLEQAYEQLKRREASRERTLAGIVSLHKPLIDLRADLSSLMRQPGALPQKIAGPLGALGQRINNLVDSVEELSRTVR